MIIGNFGEIRMIDTGKIFKFFMKLKLKKLMKFVKMKKILILKILLANEATKILHGKKASKNAEQTVKETFVEGG